MVVDGGPQELAVEIETVTNQSLQTKMVNAVSIFQEYLSRKNWSIISVDEKNYKAFLIAEHDVGKKAGN